MNRCPVGQTHTRLRQTWLETTQRLMSTTSPTLSRTLSGSGLAGRLQKRSQRASKVLLRLPVLTAHSVVLIGLPSRPKEPTSEVSKSTAGNYLTNNSNRENITVESPVLFTRESSCCFQRVLAIAILSVRQSVCHMGGSVKTVQARITKFSPSAAWKTLVLGTVKLFHKLEGRSPRTRALNERGGQNLGFLSNKPLNPSKPSKIGVRLLLITNRKSYTGSRLAPNSMTLNDLERQNRGFYKFFGDFGLRHKSISFTRWRHATIVMRSR